MIVVLYFLLARYPWVTIVGYLKTKIAFKIYTSFQNEEEEEKKTDFANNPAKSVCVFAASNKAR